MSIEHFQVDTPSTRGAEVAQEKPVVESVDSNVSTHLFEGLTQPQVADARALLSQMGRGESDAVVAHLSPGGVTAVRAYASAPAFSAERKALMPKIKDAFSHAETAYFDSLG